MHILSISYVYLTYICEYIYMDINGHPMPQNHPEPRLYIYNTHPQILNAAVIMMIMAHLVTMSLN